MLEEVHDEAGDADGLLSRRQVHQRLSHIESTISSIQAQLLENGELDTERHRVVVERLEDLQDSVAANKKLLKELKRGCLPKTKEAFVCAALALVGLWLYVIRSVADTGTELKQ